MTEPKPSPTAQPVHVGQIWQDNDKRSVGRKVRIVEVGDTHADAELVTARDGGHREAKPGRRSRIRLDRFRPTATGYRLVRDAPTGNASSPEAAPDAP